jgi:hypothetical protein
MMGLNPTLGFEIESLAKDSLVVVGDVYRPVLELRHAPSPLGDMKEIVASNNHLHAARRFLRELEAKGFSQKCIAQRMNEPMPFTIIGIEGEFAKLPPGSALQAKNPLQAQICGSALRLARRRDVEGFRFAEPDHERPRLFLLEDAICGAVNEIECNEWIPATLLPDSFQELLAFKA